MKVLTTQKAIGWPERLKGLAVGGELPVSVNNATTVRQCISRLKDITDLDFKTEKISKKVIIVRRTA